MDSKGKIGSIPFSGKLIPPDKLSSQNTNKPSNKTFIKMLILFSRICLLRSLKLKMLMNAKKTKTTQTIEINGTGPKREKSCPVMNKKIAPTSAKNIQIVCILCNIILKFWCKNKHNFLHKSKISVDLQYKRSYKRKVARLNFLTYSYL